MTHVVQNRMQKRLKKGFTIVEILIVLAIIGLLLAILLPNIGQIFRAAPRTGTDVKLKNVQTAITQYQLHALKPPTSLRDLVTKPADPKLTAKWRGPYLDEEPVDGWGNPLKYEVPGKGGKAYNLYSYGPNGPGAPQDEWISVWDL